MNREVPLYKHQDNIHCFEACLRMIMKYFWHAEDFSWEDIDKITGKPKGKLSWPLIGLVWLQKKGFEITHIESFNYKEFIKDWRKYFRKILNKEKAEEQIENFRDDEKRSMEATKEFLERANIEDRIPTVEDLKSLLTKGCLIVVNYPLIHSIVVKGFDDENLFFNNPDPNPHRFGSRSIKLNVFEKYCWLPKNRERRSVFAIKLRDE